MSIPKRTWFGVLILLILLVIGGFWILKGHRAGTYFASNATSPIQAAYTLVKESGGKSPVAAAVIVLAFEPNGVAYIYAYKPGEQLAYYGQWTYDGGTMTLKFPDISVDAHFTLRLSDEEVTLPFQVIDNRPGTSRWQRTGWPLEDAIFTTYYAALAGHPDHPSHRAAVQHAYEYAQSRITLDESKPAALSRAQDVLSAMLPAGTVYASGQAGSAPDCSDLGEPISVTVVEQDDLILNYLCGFSLEIVLQPPLSATQQQALSRAALSGDPRVYLNVKSPGNASYDPPAKTVLVIAPFVSRNPKDWANPVDTLTHWHVFLDGSPTVVPDPSKFSIVPALQADGYSPTVLKNSDATVENIANALIKNPTPGVVFFDSHGGSLGNLSTYDHWPGPEKGQRAGTLARQHMRELMAQLRQAGLGDLVDYGRTAKDTDATWFTVTLNIGLINSNDELTDSGPAKKVYTAVLMPKFWEWLETKHGADFHRSLFVVSACETDDTPTLRNTIQAGAYFAWKGTIAANLSAAVEMYLAASLTRPTHSAEEAYYNLMRLANTHQMIYAEDKLLDGLIGVKGPIDPEGAYELRNLTAYGWGGTVVDYHEAGWVGTAIQSPDKFDPTQVWWLLYVERWSADPKDGKTKIDECWNGFWSNQDLGGLRSPQCQNYNNGKLPRIDEVGYAEYLLTGDQPQGFAGVPVPRWTLNDARAD